MSIVNQIVEMSIDIINQKTRKQQQQQPKKRLKHVEIDDDYDNRHHHHHYNDTSFGFITCLIHFIPF